MCKLKKKYKWNYLQNRNSHRCRKQRYYLAIKKEWNDNICSNMNRPRCYHNKWSQKEKDKYHMILLVCGI